MANKILTSSVARPFEIFPNWDVWFENIPPSGNPERIKGFAATSN
jgi:hypothetical protein